MFGIIKDFEMEMENEDTYDSDVDHEILCYILFVHNISTIIV